MVIFNSYVKLPEGHPMIDGTAKSTRLHLGGPAQHHGDAANSETWRTEIR